MNMMRVFIGGFLTGFFAFFVAGMIYNEAASSTCERQGWSGIVCQCRLTMGYDKKKGATNHE
jgi:hypothetical protein